MYMVWQHLFMSDCQGQLLLWTLHPQISKRENFESIEVVKCQKI